MWKLESKFLSANNKQRYVELMKEEGATSEMIERQFARMERGDVGMSDLDAARFGEVRAMLEPAQEWALFDALQEASGFDDLSIEWTFIVERLEAEKAEQRKQAGL